MGSYEDNAVVDIVKLMERDLYMSGEAARGLIAHGRVTIDGYTINLNHIRRWRARQLYGRYLVAGDRQRRIMGSRLVHHHDQLQLGHETPTA